MALILLWDVNLRDDALPVLVRCKITPAANRSSGDNNVRPHTSRGNQTPVQARRAPEQFGGSAQAALAQTDDEDYGIHTIKFAL